MNTNRPAPTALDSHPRSLDTLAMALIRSDRLYTVEEYLELDQQSEERLEYDNGEIFAMAGETGQHNEVVANLIVALLAVTRDKGCRLRHQSVKLMIPSASSDNTPERKGIIRGAKRGRYYYPDLMIVCSPLIDDPRLERDPCLVIEVLSPSTAFRDRGEKMDAYLRLPSLEAYVLVNPDYRMVGVYRRTPQGWLYGMLETNEDALEVACIQAQLTLTQIYAGLKVKEALQALEDDFKQHEGRSKSRVKGRALKRGSKAKN